MKTSIKVLWIRNCR